jgi:hypothetical protein
MTAHARHLLYHYLQDQVDTLTFQSQSLRDRAQRFEEALRKNTEEQLEVGTAVRASQSMRAKDETSVQTCCRSDSWLQPPWHGQTMAVNTSLLG